LKGGGGELVSFVIVLDLDLCFVSFLMLLFYLCVFLF